MQMDAGSVVMTQSVSDLPTAMFADEATDRHENAAFDLIGSLGGITENGRLADYLSPKNITVRTFFDLRRAQLDRSTDPLTDQKNALFESAPEIALGGLESLRRLHFQEPLNPLSLTLAAEEVMPTPHLTCRLLPHWCQTIGSGGYPCLISIQRRRVILS
jgi:hypothetical protein